MNGLTQKQAEVLMYLVQQVLDCAAMPAIREICAHFQLSSLRGATVHLDALERKGMIHRGHLSRQISVTDEGLAVVGEARPELAQRIIALRLATSWDSLSMQDRCELLSALMRAHKDDYSAKDARTN